MREDGRPHGAVDRHLQEQAVHAVARERGTEGNRPLGVVADRLDMKEREIAVAQHDEVPGGPQVRIEPNRLTVPLNAEAERTGVDRLVGSVEPYLQTIDIGDVR